MHPTSPPSNPSPEQNAPPEQSGRSFVELTGCLSPSAAREHMLVVLAMGGAGEIEPVAGQPPGTSFRLWVDPACAANSLAEINAYDAEQRAIARAARAGQNRDQGTRIHSAGFGIFLMWMTTLLAVHLWRQHDPAIVSAGASTASQILGHGQWWRTITALFLHADLTHLAGNLVSGLLFSTLLSRALGPSRAWILMLGGGALGNLLAAVIKFPAYSSSIGASTAVFAALGGLSAVGLHARLHYLDHSPRSLLRMGAPVVAGFVLLGWLGGGGGEDRQVDVLGHATGFLCGLLGGWRFGKQA